ncbi:MAG: S8 family serine peptidase, partial [Chloroflexi bacterium]|nr:S8 family serine peptidase [Chloroflexota bacterium]
MQTAINNARAAGSLVVAAMGNFRTQGNPTSYPAAYANVMAVAATGPGDVYASYSQYGNHCDIAAPGGDMSYLHDPNGIYSTLPTYSVYLNTQYGMNTNYDYLDGTSMATPLAAGLVALVWGVAPTLTPDQVQGTLQSTAVDLGTTGWDVNYGWGRINALAALQAVAWPGTPSLAPISNGDGDGSYLVDWADVPYATSYTLQEDDHAGFGSPTTRYQGANSQFQATGQPGGVWYYRVQATNAAGTSAWSALQSVGVTPAAPALASISNGSQQDAYLITWSASSSATSYTLQQADNASFTSPTTRYMGTSLQYQVTGQPGGTWYYRVRAANSVGPGSWSGAQFTVVAAPGLATPSLIAIANGDGDGAYLVDWNEVAGANSYVLEQCADSYFAQPTTAYTGPASQLAVTGQPGGTWFYRVRALGAADARSPWSAAQSTVVIAYAYLPLVLQDHGGPVGGWQTIATQDFEGTFPGPWNAYDSVAADGLYYWGARNCRPYAGSRSGWAVGAGDGAGLACGSSYPLNMQSWMVYGPFSLADASAADLTFQRWLYSESDYDQFFWGASVDGSDFFGWIASGDSGGWTPSVLDLADVYSLGDLTGQSQVWVALVFVTDDSITYAEGAYVDDIVLRKYVGAGAASAVQSMPLGVRPATLTRPATDPGAPPDR